MKKILFLLAGMFLLILCNIYANDTLESLNMTKVLEITENPNKDIFLSYSEKAVADSNKNIYVLNNNSRFIYKFSPQGKFIYKIKLIKGKGPGEFSFGVFDFDISDNKIAILDAISYRITILDTNGKYLSSFNFDFPAFQIKFIGKDKILLLGKKDSKIFHLYKLDGKLEKSFGEQIDKNPIVSPQCISINGDTIYVNSPKGYNIVKYVNGEKKETFSGKRNLVGYQIKKMPNGTTAINYPSGVNSIYYRDNLIYVTTYNGKKKEFYLDIFSTPKKKIIKSINLTKWGKISYVDDDSNIYFIFEDRIIKYHCEKDKIKKD